MSHVIDLVGTTLITRFSETLSIEDVELVELHLARDSRYEKVTEIFVDLMGVDVVDFTKSKTLETSFITRAIFNKMKGMKLAVASTHPDLKELVKVFLNDFADTDWAVKSFASADDALKWLQGSS